MVGWWISAAVTISKSPGCGRFGSKTGFITLAFNFPRLDADGSRGIALRGCGRSGSGVIGSSGCGLFLPFCRGLRRGRFWMVVLIHSGHLGLRYLCLSLIGCGELGQEASPQVLFSKMKSSEEESGIDISPCVSVTTSLDLLSIFLTVKLPGVLKVASAVVIS